MGTFIIAALVMMLIVGIMSVGVLMGRKPIAGSCGGLNALGMKSACEVCGGDQKRCDDEKGRRIRLSREQMELSYDAMAESHKRAS